MLLKRSRRRHQLTNRLLIYHTRPTGMGSNCRRLAPFSSTTVSSRRRRRRIGLVIGRLVDGLMEAKQAVSWKADTVMVTVMVTALQPQATKLMRFSIGMFGWVGIANLCERALV